MVYTKSVTLFLFSLLLQYSVVAAKSQLISKEPVIVIAGDPRLVNKTYQATIDERINLLKKSRQMILVLTENWKVLKGTMFLYERKDLKSQWQLKHSAIPVVVGKKGMGWEKDTDREIIPGPVKKEGDLKAPAGVASLGTAFGFESKLKNSRYNPYLQLSYFIECVDDKRSKYYNQIVDVSKLSEKDWNSSEKMREVDIYKIGLNMGFNSHFDASNSCVFMHIWRTKNKGTAGCTAMAEDNLNLTLSWLDSTKKPVIVQLPRLAYMKIKQEWELPTVV